MIKVKLASGAKCPKQGSKEAAGYDIYASEDDFVSFGLTSKVSTGVSIKIPSGYYGKIEARSGLAFCGGVDTGAGVIDSDYRGEVKVLLTLMVAGPSVKIAKGDRIAQIIIHKVENSQDFLVVDDFYDDTERGDGGFGSTGK